MPVVVNRVRLEGLSNAMGFKRQAITLNYHPFDLLTKIQVDTTSVPNRYASTNLKSSSSSDGKVVIAGTEYESDILASKHKET